MAWDIEVLNGCAVVRMNTNKVNVQNDRFFADLHDAFDRLEREFSDLPVVLTGQGDVFSAGIDFQYSFGIFGSGSHDTIRQWYRTYRETNLRIFQYPRPTVAAVNGHAIAGGLITAFDCDFRVAARKPARFGLNEVPIGIPMPAAYVEIIKYALGGPVAALATLRGKLYELEEASRLGFFHEVVEPDKLLETAISYARCITPDQYCVRNVQKSFAGWRRATNRRANSGLGRTVTRWHERRGQSAGSGSPQTRNRA